MKISEEDRNLTSSESEPLLHLPTIEALERIARGETEAEEDLEILWNALEAVSRLSSSGGELSDLETIDDALCVLEHDATESGSEKEEPETDKGFREFDGYFQLVRLSDHPIRTLAQGLLTSYGRFLRQAAGRNSLTPIEWGILKIGIQNLAADLQASLKRKGEQP